MEKWKRPDNYIGPDYEGYYILAGTNRDSGCLNRSNFQVITERLKVENLDIIDLTDNPSPVNVRHTHWACGWIELILIHKDDKESMKIANEIEENLDNYPVLDEDHFSEMEWTELREYWDNLPTSERVELCQKYDLNIFGARPGHFPEDDSGSLTDYLRD